MYGVDKGGQLVKAQVVEQRERAAGGDDYYVILQHEERHLGNGTCKNECKTWSRGPS